MSVTYLWLICADCKRRSEEVWDDRCAECFYVHTGGDQGDDEWWSTHAVVRDGGITMDYK